MSDRTISQELTRLGLTVPDSQTIDDLTTVTVAGWPDTVTYATTLALAVLAQYPRGHMTTLEGDAEVCAHLDRAGARGECRVDIVAAVGHPYLPVQCRGQGVAGPHPGGTGATQVKQGGSMSDDATQARCYRIIRFWGDKRPRTIRQYMTRKECQAHCSRPDSTGTRGGVQWFDGFDYMRGCAPRRED